MIRTAIAAALTVYAAASHAATTYTFEPQHTQGTLRWSHLGFSHPTAQFSRVEGTLQFDEHDPTRSSVQVTIPVANLSSGVPDLDDYLRAEEFFDLAHFPTATYRSTMVEKGAAGHLKVTGELRIRGVGKPVVLDVSVNKIGTNERMHMPAVGFDATTTIKRSDFGLGLYVPQVSDEITIHITAQADESKAYAEHLKADAAQAAAAAKNAADKAATAEAASGKDGANGGASPHP